MPIFDYNHPKIKKVTFSFLDLYQHAKTSSIVHFIEILQIIHSYHQRDHTHLSLPLSIFFHQLLISINCKNQAILSFSSRYMVDLKIQQSHWQFGPYLKNQFFSEIWNLCMNIANKISVYTKLRKNKCLNFLITSKNLWPIFSLFLPFMRQNFLQSLRKKNDPVPRKRLHTRKDKRQDRQADPTLYDLSTAVGGPKRTIIQRQQMKKKKINLELQQTKLHRY